MNPDSLRQLLAVAKPMTLASILPLALGLIETGDRNGVDMGPPLRPLLIALAAIQGISFPGATTDQLTQPSRAEQIDSLYDELAELAEAALIDPAFEDDYRAVLGQLRELQGREAAELETRFRARAHLDPAMLEDALARADRLLSET